MYKLCIYVYTLAWQEITLVTKSHGLYTFIQQNEL